MITQPILAWIDRMQAPLMLVGLLGIVALVNGCAAAAAVPVSSLVGSVSGSAIEIHHQTEVRLQEANFMVTKLNVIGQSGGFSLFGLLPIVPPKFGKALSRLYMQADMELGRSQTLANLIIERNNTYLVLFSLPRISVRADVIEFRPAAIANPLSGNPEPATEECVLAPHNGYEKEH